MMRPKYRRIFITTIRFGIGILFLASGIGKLINSTDARFLVELMATKFYWLIEYVELIVMLTSALELVIALLLLWGRYLLSAFTAALMMLLGFTGILGYFYLQGMNVENCGCFGALGFASGLDFTLLRNLVLIALITGAYLLMPGEGKIKNYKSEAESINSKTS